MRGRGLKPGEEPITEYAKTSPSMRGRGLKHFEDVNNAAIASPSMRGRGLKPSIEIDKIKGIVVALHAGAWIETRKST